MADARDAVWTSRSNACQLLEEGFTGVIQVCKNWYLGGVNINGEQLYLSAHRDEDVAYEAQHNFHKAKGSR